MTPEFWALIGVSAVVAWQGGAITNTLRVAANERRQDHTELLEVIEKLAHDVSFLERYVGAIEGKVNPPDLSACE